MPYESGHPEFQVQRVDEIDANRMSEPKEMQDIRCEGHFRPIRIEISEDQKTVLINDENQCLVRIQDIGVLTVLGYKTAGQLRQECKAIDLLDG